MTDFTKDQLQHIIVLNADRLFDTQAQPGWTKLKIVEAIIEKAQMIVETPDNSLEEYRVVGQTILDYVRDIEFATHPPEREFDTVVVTGDLIDDHGMSVSYEESSKTLNERDGDVELQPNPGAVRQVDAPTHTVGLIEFNRETQHWEAVRDVKGGETEEEFNQRNADFHKRERERHRVEVKPVYTTQQRLARVFGEEEK